MKREMLSSLYNIIIYPIEILLEVVYSVLYEYRHNAGMSIIGVSIVINLLLLPLYNRADSISKEERLIQQSMSRWVSHIKKTFKGDERFMMLQTYYKKNGYKPIYSLRSSISLLLQIPFFIAAYHFLSSLSTLNGTSFLWLKDLGQPDQLIVIPSVYLNLSTGMIPLKPIVINILPILMTIINIMSCIVYTKNSTRREKIQLYTMAAIFLVLLYDSPSGLVIYWTANNVFSLLKNAVYALKTDRNDSKDLDKRTDQESASEKKWGITYWGGALLLTVLTGAVIPSSVIVSSPAEFVTTVAYRDPLQYVWSSLCISGGLFLLWGSLFYYLSSDKLKCVWRVTLWVMSVVSLTDFLVFGKNLVNLSSDLKYDTEPVYSVKMCTLNTVAVVLLVVLCVLFYKWLRSRIIPVAYILFTVSLVALFTVNAVRTEHEMSDMSYLKQKPPYDGFTLSKTGRNVIVIMLDRAIGPYLPFAFAERPELVDKFSGFTYYPNAVSHGYGTKVGSAALFGGYEYSLPEVNKRKDELCVDKHNQALLLMPIIFSENGYRTTVYDAPFANYKWEGDMSIYDPYPDIRGYRLKEQFVETESFEADEELRRRQFFMYSVYKTMPIIFNNKLYNEGWYLYPDTFDEPNLQFNDCYAILHHLRSLTKITDSDENTFMMMDNDITHSPCELQLPDYTPSVHLDNEGLETGYRTDMMGNTLVMDSQYHYHTYMAALLAIGEWLDYLREEGVYDNTRIIIAADHGQPLEQFENLVLEDGMDAEQLSILLMCKDFDSDEYNVSFELMTNADCPTLAMEGLINNPKNPFSGNPVTDKEKYENGVFICPRPEDGEYTFDTEGQSWYTVHDSIYDRSNWSVVDDPTKTVAN